MTEDEFKSLKERILANGGRYHEPVTDPMWSDSSEYWFPGQYEFYLKYVSTRSKYNGSILQLHRIKDDKIRADCSIAGAPKINPESHFKNYEFTNERREQYVDGTASTDTVKDFFNDNIDIGDYVFGEYNRDVVFGVVRSTKKGTGKKKGYHSKKLEHDAAMIEVVKSKNRSWNCDSTGEILLMEMRYFIKVEDPIIYLLKL